MYAWGIATSERRTGARAGGRLPGRCREGGFFVGRSGGPCCSQANGLMASEHSRPEDQARGLLLAE